VLKINKSREQESLSAATSSILFNKSLTN